MYLGEWGTERLDPRARGRTDSPAPRHWSKPRKCLGSHHSLWKFVGLQREEPWEIGAGSLKRNETYPLPRCPLVKSKLQRESLVAGGWGEPGIGKLHAVEGKSWDGFGEKVRRQIGEEVFPFLKRSGLGEDLQTKNPPVSAKLMISYSCPLSASGRAPCGDPWRRCSAVLRAARDTGRLSVGRWLRCSLSKMLLLARLRSSSRWLSRSKAGPPHARH